MILTLCRLVGIYQLFWTYIYCTCHNFEAFYFLEHPVYFRRLTSERVELNVGLVVERVPVIGVVLRTVWSHWTEIRTPALTPRVLFESLFFSASVLEPNLHAQTYLVE